VLQRTGTSHLVAVSGLHIAIVAGLSFWLMLRCALCLPGALARHAQSLAAGLCLIPATAYAALAGFGLPTRRALVMLLAAEILIVTRRRWPFSSAFSLALIVVLALDPAASLSASFWLSFGAVALLLVAALSPGRARSAARMRATAWLAEFGRVHWALTLGLIPLSLWYFGQFSLASFFVNAVAIPVFSLLIVPLSLLAALIAALAIDDPWLTPLTAALAQLAWQGFEFAAAMPFAALALPKPPLPEVLLGSAAILLALPWHPLPGRRFALLGMLPLLLSGTSRLPEGEARINVLDVGQGLAVAIETRRHRALYDAGPRYRSGFDAGAEIVGPALEALGVRRLDRLIVSHGDADHAGGMDAILARFPEATLLAGPDVLDARAAGCFAGDAWDWDGVSFSILHPPVDFGPPGNETSCVLRIETAGGTVLLTGDIERRAESILTRTEDIAAEVVVVPHHGSRTSSTARFVEQVKARYAIVSAGHRNRWGFPLPEISQRWEEAGARVLVTGETGAIEVKLAAAGIELGAARDRRHRYWQAEREAFSGARGVSAL
jgi:competence protein ComEC